MCTPKQELLLNETIFRQEPRIPVQKSYQSVKERTNPTDGRSADANRSPPAGTQVFKSEARDKLVESSLVQHFSCENDGKTGGSTCRVSPQTTYENSRFVQRSLKCFSHEN